MKVAPIPKEETKEWLLFKHYAKRIPPIMYSFGLYDGVTLIGVITFGPPCRSYNSGEFVFNNGYRVETVELNRLCIIDNAPKNTLSFFVSSALNLLPKPCCVVSYADNGQGHHGYIYQATNWIYTGLNEIHDTEYIVDGKKVHSRTLTGQGITAPKEWAKANNIQTTDKSHKHRYFMFVGDKKQKKEMKKNFRFEVMPYPKGNNTRYDSSYNPLTQDILF